MRLVPLLVVFVSGLLVACAPETTTPATPEKAAAKFYAKRLALKIQGLPDEQQLAALAPYLTPELRALFVAASREQQDFMKKHPDEKPPWIEGDLFSSLFEGVSTHQTGAATIARDRAEVRVDCTYTWRGETSRWHDLIILRQREGRWLVDDILMKGEWAFKSGASLRGVLSARD